MDYYINVVIPEKKIIDKLNHKRKKIYINSLIPPHLMSKYITFTQTTLENEKNI